MAEHHKDLMAGLKGIRNLDKLEDLPQSMSSARTVVYRKEVRDLFMTPLTVH